MAEVKYTQEQIKELKWNINVNNCTSKHIVFSKEFKIETVKLSKNYVTSKEIFKKYWFPDYVINSDVPKSSISRWKRNIKIKWQIEENKWRKKKEKCDVSKMTKDEYIEYLETENAILKELKKLVDWDYP